MSLSERDTQPHTIGSIICFDIYRRPQWTAFVDIFFHHSIPLTRNHRPYPFDWIFCLFEKWKKLIVQLSFNIILHHNVHGVVYVEWWLNNVIRKALTHSLSLHICFNIHKCPTDNNDVCITCTRPYITNVSFLFYILTLLNKKKLELLSVLKRTACLWYDRKKNIRFCIVGHMFFQIV